MLTNTGRKKHGELKTMLYGIIGGLGLLQTALMTFAAAAPPNLTERPLVRINPDYPALALRENMEGWVNVKFTINETGAVEDPTIVDNCAWLNGADPDTCKSDDMFNEAALAAVSRWRYAPAIEDGAAVAREGMHTIIHFTLEDPEKKKAE